MNALARFSLCLALILGLNGAAWAADDLMENDDLGPGGDLGEPPALFNMPAPNGQHSLIEQAGSGLQSSVIQSGIGQSVQVQQYR